MGHIPDGTYRIVGDTIELLSGPQRSRADLERLAQLLRSARQRGATLDEIRVDVAREVPELASLADILPRTRNELYAFIGVVLTILTLILTQLKDDRPVHVEVTQVINQITQVEAAPSAPQARVRESSSLRTQQPGRNQPCHCGSGKKYKKCCLNRR